MRYVSLMDLTNAPLQPLSTTLPIQAEDPSPVSVLDQRTNELLASMSGNLADRAVDVYRRILDDEAADYDIQLKAANQVLDRIGANRTEQLKVAAATNNSREVVFVLPEEALSRTTTAIHKTFISTDFELVDEQ